jgi:hypothetical protein
LDDESMTTEELDSLITDILEGKRCVPAKVRNDLMFTMIAALYREVRSTSARVTKVESYSIIMWMERHPKATMVLFALGLAFLAWWSTPEFRRPVLAAFGLPQQLVP